MRSLVWKLVLVALMLALGAAPVPRASVAWAASPALVEAQSLYDGAKFNEAITMIRDALSTGKVTGHDAIEARALMARCQVKTGNRVEAKEGFKFVLRQDSGWRPNAATVPPDEQEVFELARKELTAEQIEAGKRIPASLSFNVGTGPGEHEGLAEVVVASGGPDHFTPKMQLGGSVRFPVAQRYSLDLELQRLRSTATGDNSGNITEFEASAYPLSLSLYYSLLSKQKFRVNLFAGGGVLSSAGAKIDLILIGPGTSLTISGQKNAPYFHGGIEAEYLVFSRFALAGRVMGRSAKAENVLEDSDFTYYGASLQDRDVDFSGFAATIGLRAYVGY
jgi:hypothetical protein